MSALIAKGGADAVEISVTPAELTDAQKALIDSDATATMLNGYAVGLRNLRGDVIPFGESDDVDLTVYIPFTEEMYDYCNDGYRLVVSEIDASGTVLTPVESVTPVGLNPKLYFTVDHAGTFIVSYAVDESEQPETPEQPEQPETPEQPAPPAAEDVVITNDQGATLVRPSVGNGEADEQWTDVTLVTEWLGGDVATTAGKAVTTAIDNVVQMYVYDIHLEDGAGSEFAVPEGDTVRVTLPLPEDMPADGVHVFHVAEDGTVTDMNATVDPKARTVSFSTTHFSTFVIARVDEKEAAAIEKPVTPALPQTGDTLAPIVLAAIAVAGAAALGAGLVLKRR